MDWIERGEENRAEHADSRIRWSLASWRESLAWPGHSHLLSSPPPHDDRIIRICLISFLSCFLSSMASLSPLASSLCRRPPPSLNFPSSGDFLLASQRISASSRLSSDRIARVFLGSSAPRRFLLSLPASSIFGLSESSQFETLAAFGRSPGEFSSFSREKFHKLEEKRVSFKVAASLWSKLLENAAALGDRVDYPTNRTFKDFHPKSTRVEEFSRPSPPSETPPPIEISIGRFLRSHSIRYLSESELQRFQLSEFGRPLSTPDYFLVDRLDVEIREGLKSRIFQPRWIEVKASFGAFLASQTGEHWHLAPSCLALQEQLFEYQTAFGPGLVVFSPGFCRGLVDRAVLGSSAIPCKFSPLWSAEAIS